MSNTDEFAYSTSTRKRNQATQHRQDSHYGLGLNKNEKKTRPRVRTSESALDVTVHITRTLFLGCSRRFRSEGWQEVARTMFIGMSKWANRKFKTALCLGSRPLSILVCITYIRYLGDESRHGLDRVCKLAGGQAGIRGTKYQASRFGVSDTDFTYH